MDKLRQAVDDKQRQKDPSWLSLYNTDIKNLFPKCQLAKIEIAKINYDKFRLIFDNIQDFILIQKHRNSAKSQLESIDSLKNQLEQLEQSYEKEYLYHNDIIKERDQAQSLASQLNRYGHEILAGTGHKNQLLAFTASNSTIWNKFFQENCQSASLNNPQNHFGEKIQLAKTISIPSNTGKVNDSTCSQILIQRFTTNQLRRKNLQYWINNREQKQTQQNSLSKFSLDQWRITMKEVDFTKFI